MLLAALVKGVLSYEEQFNFHGQIKGLLSIEPCAYLGYWMQCVVKMCGRCVRRMGWTMLARSVVLFIDEHVGKVLDVEARVMPRTQLGPASGSRAPLPSPKALCVNSRRAERNSWEANSMQHILLDDEFY